MWVLYVGASCLRQPNQPRQCPLCVSLGHALSFATCWACKQESSSHVLQPGSRPQVPGLRSSSWAGGSPEIEQLEKGKKRQKLAKLTVNYTRETDYSINEYRNLISFVIHLVAHCKSFHKQYLKAFLERDLFLKFYCITRTCYPGFSVEMLIRHLISISIPPPPPKKNPKEMTMLKQKSWQVFISISWYGYICVSV